MKLFVSALVMGLGFASVGFGKDLVCRQDAQDNVYVAFFSNVGQKEMDVKLYVPVGETDGNLYEATCVSDQGAIEAAYTCEVFTSSDSGYSVKLFSIGSSDLYGSVKEWNMAGEYLPVPLTCDNSVK